jgi:hypothetical protein
MFVTYGLHGPTDEVRLGIYRVVEGFIYIKEVFDVVNFVLEGVVGDHSKVGTIDRDIHAKTATTVTGAKTTTTISRGLELA